MAEVKNLQEKSDLTGLTGKESQNVHDVNPGAAEPTKIRYFSAETENKMHLATDQRWGRKDVDPDDFNVGS